MTAQSKLLVVLLVGLFCFSTATWSQDRRTAALAWPNLGEPFSRGPTAAADWGDGRVYLARGLDSCLFDRRSGQTLTLEGVQEPLDAVVEWDAENLLAFQGDRFFWYSKSTQAFSFGGTLRDWGLPPSWLRVDAGLLASSSAMLLFSNDAGGQYLILDPSSLRVTGPFQLQEWPSWPKSWTTIDAALNRSDGFFIFFSSGEMLIWDPEAELFVGDGPLLLDGLPSAGGGVHLLRPRSSSAATGAPRPPSSPPPAAAPGPALSVGAELPAPADPLAFPVAELPLEIAAAVNWDAGTLLLFHPDGSAGYLDPNGTYEAVPDWDLEIDAAVWYDAETILLFSGDSWTTLDPATAEVSDAWQPLAQWQVPAGWDAIDAAVRTDPYTLVLYRDGEAFYVFPADNQVAGPSPLAEIPGWSPAWSDGIDAAVSSFDGRLYFFRGQEVARFDFDTQTGTWGPGQAPERVAETFTADLAGAAASGGPAVPSEPAADLVLESRARLGIPWAVAPEGITAAVGWGEGGLLVFSSEQSGSLVLPAGEYEGGEAFPESIDAADWFADDVLVLASGDRFWTLDLTQEVESEPATLAELGLAWDHVDAMVQWTETELLWLSGSQFSLYDPVANTTTPAAPVTELGLAWPDGRIDGVEAAFNLGAGGLYFVRDGQILVVDLVSKTVLPLGLFVAPQSSPEAVPVEAEGSGAEDPKDEAADPAPSSRTPSPDLSGVWTRDDASNPRLVGDICASHEFSIVPVPVLDIVKAGRETPLLLWATKELGVTLGAAANGSCDEPLVVLDQDPSNSKASPKPTILCPDGAGGYLDLAKGTVLTVRSGDSLTWGGVGYTRQDKRRRTELGSEDRFTVTLTAQMLPGGLESNAMAYDLRSLNPEDFSLTGLDQPRRLFERLDEAGGLDLASNELSPAGDQMFVPWGLKRHRKYCSNGSSGAVEILNGQELATSLASNVRSQVAFTASNRNVQEAVKRMYQSKVSRVREEAFFVRHLLVLDVPNVYSLLTDEFRAAVGEVAAGRLGPAELFKRFGTHYPMAVAYGGSSVKDVTLTSSQYSKSWLEDKGVDVNTQVDVNAQVSGGGASVGLGGGGFGRGLGSQSGGQDKSFVSFVLNEESWRNLGGTCGHTVESCSHASSAGDAPVWLDLRPLYELLAPPFFTDPEVFGPTRAKVASAFERLFGADPPRSWLEQAMPRYLPLSESANELRVNGTFYAVDPAAGGRLVETVSLKAIDQGLRAEFGVVPRLAPNFYTNGDREYRFQSRFKGQLIRRQSGRVLSLESCGLPLASLSPEVQKVCGKPCEAPLGSVQDVGTIAVTVRRSNLAHGESETFSGGECWCNGIDPGTQLMRCDHVTWTQGTRSCYDGKVQETGLKFNLESDTGNEVTNTFNVILGQLGGAAPAYCAVSSGGNPTTGKVICACEEL